jgi:predicted DNA-binding transcriptional regulator AlpA
MKAAPVTNGAAMTRPSYSISEWCELRKVSRSMFYKLDSQGKAPRTYNIGTKRAVSPEADDEWVRAREAESAERDVEAA